MRERGVSRTTFKSQQSRPASNARKNCRQTGENALSVQRRNHIPLAILDWIWEKLEECPIIQNHFGNWLEEHRHDSNQEREKHFRQWISEQKERFEAYFNLRWTLQEIENEAPDVLSEVSIRTIMFAPSMGSKLLSRIQTNLKLII